MAFTNKNQFMGLMHKFVDEVEQGTEEEVRRTARTLLQHAIRLSPFDTGRFISSWRISTDKNGHDAGPGSRGSIAAAAAEAQSISNAYIVSYRLGQPLFLTNGAPYARYIEYGAPTIRAHYIIRQAVAAAASGPKFFGFADEGVVEGDLGG